MKTFYFVGGPKAGQVEEFFRRLNQAGGTPSGWRVYPHAGNDTKALHIAEVGSQDEILHHLEDFKDIYEWGEIVEIIDPLDRQSGRPEDSRP